MHEIVAAFGGLDLWSTMPAPTCARAIDVTPPSGTMMTVNVTGTFHLTQQVGRHLMGAAPGAVVTIASTYALRRRARALDLRHRQGGAGADDPHARGRMGEHGIRVNAIAPGRMETASPSGPPRG